jgi:hypothetical protein
MHIRLHPQTSIVPLDYSISILHQAEKHIGNKQTQYGKEIEKRVEVRMCRVLMQDRKDWEVSIVGGRLEIMMAMWGRDG